MAAVVEAWMSELRKLKEKLEAKKRLMSSSKAEQRQQEERELGKQERRRDAGWFEIQRDLDSSSLSEDTVCLFMDRFVPW
ncbi:hypothetical protein ACFX12_020279 [Malus domestica]